MRTQHSTSDIDSPPSDHALTVRRIFSRLDKAIGAQLIDPTGRYILHVEYNHPIESSPVESSPVEGSIVRLVRAGRPAQALARVLAEDGHDAGDVELVSCTHYADRPRADQTTIVTVAAGARTYTCLSASCPEAGRASFR
jgi:hypothetical protein